MLVMAFCFFTDLILSDPDWLGMVWGTVWPHIPTHKAGQIGILSLFGATLIPHNLFMQSGMVKDKKVDPKNRYKLAEIIRYSYIETAISIFFCLLINVAVIATFTNWNGSEDLKGDMKINMFTAGDFFEKELGIVA
jgi:NRAMP (natural resistance-associated macrophage protein)-like metal ion transporter